MTIQELLNKYYFHDSFINEVKVINKDLDFSIVFCTWLQNYYNENEMPEKEVIRLKFKNAKMEKEEKFEFNGDTIIQAKEVNNENMVCGIEFTIISEELGYETTIKVFADSVEWINCGEPDWSK